MDFYNRIQTGGRAYDNPIEDEDLGYPASVWDRTRIPNWPALQAKFKNISEGPKCNNWYLIRVIKATTSGIVLAERHRENLLAPCDTYLFQRTNMPELPIIHGSGIMFRGPYNFEYGRILLSGNYIDDAIVTGLMFHHHSRWTVFEFLREDVLKLERKKGKKQNSVIIPSWMTLALKNDFRIK